MNHSVEEHFEGPLCGLAQDSYELSVSLFLGGQKMSDRKTNILVILLIVMVTVIPAAFTTAVANVESQALANPLPTPGDKPAYAGYKGVAFGTPMEEARTKLGTPKEKSDTQDFYVFSDNESAQVYYGPAKTVTAMTITFTGKLDSAPTAKTVFGEDVEAKPDGGIFKMVRYPKAGFWISYNKIAGDDPMVMVAIQKM